MIGLMVLAAVALYLLISVLVVWLAVRLGCDSSYGALQAWMAGKGMANDCGK